MSKNEEVVSLAGTLLNYLVDKYNTTVKVHVGHNYDMTITYPNKKVIEVKFEEKKK